MSALLQTSSSRLAYALLAGALGTLLGAFAPGVWVWPLVMGLSIYPLYVREALRPSPVRSTLLLLAWALACTLALWSMAAARGLDDLGPHVFRGPSYAAEMLHWVRTGEGAEGSPALFLPSHARHLAGFAVASLLTGGFLGLCFGALLLNYMNFYVASLAATSTSPALAYVIGWHPWAVLRVAGFIALGIGLGHLFLTRFARRAPFDSTAFRTLTTMGLALVVADALLKASLADSWRLLVARILRG